MRTLEFSATGQRLVATNKLDGLIAGSKGYLQTKFNFDSAHAGCRHIAVFTNRMGTKEIAVQLDKDNACMIPDDIAAELIFKVCVVSLNTDYRVRTGKVTVRQNG